MHELGIVHRDLKLDNVMIQVEDHNQDDPAALTKFEVRIIDFGLSTQFNPSPEDKGEQRKLKNLVGTPNYIAPEILRYSYDEKCDIWSLGVIAYQLFS